jgi:DNA polymerase I-like protein with 3'-5' exonuclease and polymerase domains
LIKPAHGRALAYLDWCSQEICVAAALSGDKALLRLIETSDPYIVTAIAARLAPAGATKQSHPAARELCKTVLLGMVYGMQPPTLSLRTGLPLIEARELLAWVRRTFPTLAQWSDDVADAGQLTGASTTRLGWVLQTTGHSSRTVRNFPVQANGAEILRLAICLATEAGIDVCAQVHDAILVEADADKIEDVVRSARTVMAQASAMILGGMEIGTDAEVVTWPNRYLPDKGRAMWQLVMRSLQKFDQTDQIDHRDQGDQSDLH